MKIKIDYSKSQHFILNAQSCPTLNNNQLLRQGKTILTISKQGSFIYNNYLLYELWGIHITILMQRTQSRILRIFSNATWYKNMNNSMHNVLGIAYLLEIEANHHNKLIDLDSMFALLLTNPYVRKLNRR